jgi:hypothetical protein
MFFRQAPVSKGGFYDITDADAVARAVDRYKEEYTQEAVTLAIASFAWRSTLSVEVLSCVAEDGLLVKYSRLHGFANQASMESRLVYERTKARFYFSLPRHGQLFRGRDGVVTYFDDQDGAERTGPPGPIDKRLSY